MHKNLKGMHIEIFIFLSFHSSQGEREQSERLIQDEMENSSEIEIIQS